MASNAPIGLQDGKASPVTHTFTGNKVSGDLASYDNRAEPVSNCREELSLRMTKGPKVRTVKVNLMVPRVVTETLNGVDVKTVPDYFTAKAEILAPNSWAADDVKDGRTLLAHALLHTVVEAMADDGEFVW